MGFGGGSVVVGYRYYLTLLMGLCRGPIDEIVEIKIGDRTAWPIPQGEEDDPDDPVAPINDTMTTAINAPELFGGDKREGGIDGTLDVYFGKRGQTIANKYKTLIGGRVPDFRGVVTLFFDGLIASLNPYPKEWKVRLRRTTAGWDGPVWRPELCVIWLNNKKIKAMNPAHILYEVATNYDWGRGLSRDRLDDSVWSDTARKFHREKFGLCVKWVRDGDLGEFVGMILNHVGGTIYTDRETGLICLKPIRKDYKFKNLPLYTYRTGLIEVSEDATLMDDKIVSEIVVKYHTPINDTDQKTRAQNLALIQSTGTKNSTEVDYSAAPTFVLASRLAQRDLRAMAVTSRYTIKLDRRAWNLFPGKAFRISAPDKGIENLVLRAGKIQYGTMTDGVIIVDASLDVFAMNSAEFVNDTDDPPFELPSPIPQPITDRLVRELTYYDYVTNFDRYTWRNIEEDDTGIAVFAARPTVTSGEYLVYSRSGAGTYGGKGSPNFVASGILTGAMTPYETSLALNTVLEGESLQNDMLIQIDDEIMHVTGHTFDKDALTATMTVERGVVDTIPQPHATNARFFDVSDLGSDGKDWLRNDVVDVKLLTKTSSALLKLSLAPVDTVTLLARQNRPYPPGNVVLNAQPIFNGVTAGDPNNIRTLTGPTLSLSWAHRDRKTQKDVIVAHGDSSIGPESGTQYRVRILQEGVGPDTVVHSEDISGTSWSFDLTTLTSGPVYKVSLNSNRDAGTFGWFAYVRRFSI